MRQKGIMKTKYARLAKAAALLSLLAFTTGTIAATQRITFTRGKIEAIDSTNLTLTVKVPGQPESLILWINSQTRFFKDGEPAAHTDLAVGDEVRGTARREANGKLIAIRIDVTKAASVLIARSNAPALAPERAQRSGASS